MHHSLYQFPKFLVPPQITPFDFGEEAVNEGDGVSAQCTIAKGDYPLNITWYLDDKPASSVNGVLINRVSKRVSTLSIDYVLETHSGRYNCVATNKAASVSFGTSLAVKGTTLLVI